jgi:hypothetical protein
MIFACRADTGLGLHDDILKANFVAATGVLNWLRVRRHRCTGDVIAQRSQMEMARLSKYYCNKNTLICGKGSGEA